MIGYVTTQKDVLSWRAYFVIVLFIALSLSMSPKKPAKKKAEKKKKAKQLPSVAECVSIATEQFLDDMGHTSPDNLHKVIMSEAERALIATVLEHTDSNQSKAAEILGITRATLRSRMTRYKI